MLGFLLIDQGYFYFCENNAIMDIHKILILLLLILKINLNAFQDVLQTIHFIQQIKKELNLVIQVLKQIPTQKIITIILKVNVELNLNVRKTLANYIQKIIIVMINSQIIIYIKNSLIKYIDSSLFVAVMSLLISRIFILPNAPKKKIL